MDRVWRALNWIVGVCGCIFGVIGGLLLIAWLWRELWTTSGNPEVYWPAVAAIMLIAFAYLLISLGEEGLEILDREKRRKAKRSS